MRIPAIGWEPPISTPGGVLPATATMAALKTSVSPDGRNRRSGYAPEPAAPAGPAPAEPVVEQTREPEPEREPLPVYYPPLSQQRAVLERPVAPHPAAPDARAEPAPAPSAPPAPPAQRRSELDETMWRVMGTV